MSNNQVYSRYQILTLSISFAGLLGLYEQKGTEPPLPTIVVTSLFIMLLVWVWAYLTHHYEELISVLLGLLVVVEVTAVWIIRKYRNRKR